MPYYIYELILYGLPVLGGITTLILEIKQRQDDATWYKICPGRKQCGFDKCMRHSLYGCPVSPGGVFLTEEEREEIRKIINKLD